MTRISHKKTKHGHRQILVVYGLLLVIGFGLGAGVFYKIGWDARLKDSVTLQTYTANTTINTARFDIALSNIARDAKGGHAFKPAKGSDFLTMTIFIKNRTSQEMSVFPVNQTELKDDHGHVYRMTVAELADPFQAGHLRPGDQIQGQLAFEIPSSLQHPVFFFDSGWPDSNVAIRI